MFLVDRDSESFIIHDQGATFTLDTIDVASAVGNNPAVGLEIRGFLAGSPTGTVNVPTLGGGFTNVIGSSLGVVDRMKLATRGTREQRAVLVRDPNRLVAAAVLSSPKLTESEVEQFAKMANVAEDILRVIGTNRAWTKNYGVVAGLVRNPKTPLAISLTLLQRVNDKDVKMLAIDRNIPEPLRIAARKRASAARLG